MAEQALVGIIMGSKSDWDTMRHAAETLDQTFGLHRVSRLDPGTNAVRKVFSDLEPDCPNRRQVIAVNLADPARNTARPPRRSGRRRQS